MFVYDNTNIYILLVPTTVLVSLFIKVCKKHLAIFDHIANQVSRHSIPHIIIIYIIVYNCYFVIFRNVSHANLRTYWTKPANILQVLAYINNSYLFHKNKQQELLKSIPHFTVPLNWFCLINIRISTIGTIQSDRSWSSTSNLLLISFVRTQLQYRL